MSEDLETAFACHHLSFAYNHTPILIDVTCTVPQGAFISIIGPNGGGKTTFLRLLLGLLKPTQGSCLVFGTPPFLGQKGVSYVPQTTSLDPHFPINALDVVLGGLLSQLPWHGHFSKDLRKKALHALEQVELAQVAHLPFGELSGGQQQRVLIARALVAEPKLLLLDEPTANIDPKAEEHILSILRSLRKKLTIVMVTHNLQLAIHQVDQILCLQRILTVYAPHQLCQHYAIGLYHSL